jgi:hypothetical protein
MKAKINENIICIPPYISTSWEKVTFMRAQDNLLGGLDLVMQLTNGSEISIGNLDKSLIDLAFSAHLKYLENQTQKKESLPKGPLGPLQSLMGMTPEQLEAMSFRLSSPLPGMDSLELAMQHDLAKAHTPDLPEDILKKVSQMTRLIIGEDVSMFPKPEPHCNCPHCQIARSIHGIEKKGQLPQEEIEEEVLADELTFQDWKIQPINEHLFHVSNPLDCDETYQVYLGSPVGCTCGKPHCEHIKAVLRS